MSKLKIIYNIFLFLYFINCIAMNACDTCNFLSVCHECSLYFNSNEVIAALINAIDENNIDKVKSIATPTNIKKYIMIQNTKYTVLDYVFKNNKWDVARYFIKQFNCVDYKDSLSQTLLHIAARYHESSIIKLLIEHNCSVDSESCLFLTPIMECFQDTETRTDPKKITECAILLVNNGQLNLHPYKGKDFFTQISQMVGKDNCEQIVSQAFDYASKRGFKTAKWIEECCKELDLNYHVKYKKD